MNRTRLAAALTTPLLALALGACAQTTAHVKTAPSTAPAGTPIVSNQPADTPTPSDTSSSTTRQAVGTTFTLTDDQNNVGEVTVTRIIRHASARDPYTGTVHPDNGSFIVIYALYHAIRGTLDYNQFDFGAQAADGTINTTMDGKSTDAETALNLSGGLDSGTLTAGQQRRGYILIDGPVHGSIVYTAGSSVVGSWRY